MYQKYYNLVLTLPIEIACETGVDIALNETERVLKDTGYDEGRYPFSREVLLHALKLSLEKCVYESVFKFFEQKHGNETVFQKFTENCSGETRKSLVETEAWMKNDFKWISIKPILDAKLIPITREQWRKAD